MLEATEIFTVYRYLDNPAESQIVVKRIILTPDKVLPILDTFIRAPNLDFARWQLANLRAGLRQIKRDENDPPDLVERWL